MKKKILLFCLAGTLISVGFSGCMQTQQPAEEESVSQQEEGTEDSGTVSLTVWAEESDFDLLNIMIESFKEEYADQAEFEITLVAQADSGTKAAVLGDVLSAGDVFSFPDDQFSGLLASGVLEPVENADEVTAANLEGAVEAASYNGTLYAYPYTADNGYFLYYNTEYLTEEDVQTLDGILDAADAAGKKFSMEFNSGWYLYAFFGLTGLEFGINDDGVTNYCNWNATDTEITGLDVAEALVQIVSRESFLSQGDGDFADTLSDGEVIAAISGTWNAVAVQAAWGDHYAAVKLPTYTCAGQQIQMSSFKGYKMMGVNAYSENKAWAMKLADWLTNEENQTLRLTMNSQGPSNINAGSSPEIEDMPAIQAVLAQSEYGVLQRVGDKFWTPCTTFADTLTAGNLAGTSLQELLDTLVDGITASVAQ